MLPACPWIAPDLSRTASSHDGRTVGLLDQHLTRSGTMRSKLTPRSPADNGEATHSLKDDRGWALLRSWLPADLDAIAHAHGAILRERKICDGALLVRLALLYATCLRSLAVTAAWAARAFALDVTPDALSYRFRQSVTFLKAITASVLTARLRGPSIEGVALRLIDATSICGPGAEGTEWRIHLTYDPGQGAVCGAEITDEHGGEHLNRAAAEPHDLVIGDRGYGHARDVRAARHAERKCLIRGHLQSLAITDLAGVGLTPRRLIDDAQRGHWDRDVMLLQRGFEPEPVRLVIVPLPIEAASRARQKLAKAAKKKGRRPDALAMELAGYLCLLTTLSREHASVPMLCRWYRIRWQVELFFKRARQMLHLGQVRGGDDLVQLQLWAQVLLSALCEWGASGLCDAPRVGPNSTPVSLWRAVRIVALELLQALLGDASLEDHCAKVETTRTRLRDRPRRRRSYAAATIDEILTTLNPSETAVVTA